jgi:alpha-glucosidase
MHSDSNIPWWRRGVFYQVYIRSFADGNGDGIGDIEGIRSRLPYLASLGIDAIWVNPWYPSPLNDGGYDVADYTDINPLFGTLDGAKTLIDEAAELGIRIMVDLVPNHTSSDHEWFDEALEAPRGSAARERYIFRDGRGPDGDLPPNNWMSVFGGSTWTRVSDGQWYLHLFDPTQPDLNWENPKVRADIEDVLRFWLDLGAVGFRVDVAHGLAKDPELPDMDYGGIEGGGTTDQDRVTARLEHPHWDRDDVHDIIRGWRSVLDEYPGSVMVAEAWVANWERLARYLRPGEFHQVFDFDFLECEWDARELRAVIDESLEATGSVGSAPTWVLSNHDLVRHATRYGLPPGTASKPWLLEGDRSELDVAVGLRRARAAALLMFALPGSCYVYQGDELGLPEVHDLPEDVLDDPVWVRSDRTEKGRDGCRVPLPWKPEGPSFGFGEGGSWLPQPEGWGGFSVAVQDGVAGSTLELYRRALELRRDLLTGDEGLVWLDLGEDVLAFERSHSVVCVVNFSEAAVRLPPGEVLVSSAPIDAHGLASDAAAWVLTR